MTKNITRNTAIIGFCCDEGVRRNNGRVGAVSGPEALRKEVFFNIQKNHQPLDAGNITCVDKDLEKSQQEFSKKVTALQEKKHLTNKII